MPNSVRRHRWQPIRFCYPWDSPGKNTGVDCHFLLQCMKVKSQSKIAQSCPTLCNPMDCCLPGSSLHEIFPGKSSGEGCHYLLCIIRDWNGKEESQEIPGVTGKFGLGVQNEAWQSLIEFCQENALVIANTLFQQHKRRLYTWTSPDGQHQNQIDYNLCSQNWKSSIQSTKARLGTDCGTDHELLIAKFRFKLK